MTGDRLRLGLRITGDLLLTAAAVILLFFVYEMWFTNLLEARSQHALRTQLEQIWDRAPTPVSHAGSARVAPVAVAPFQVPGLGKPFALLTIPRLSITDVVVEGTGHDQLKLGPGHYVGTAVPGQIGNMVISGHRTTYGAPFRNLDALSLGDAIEVQTATTTYTYRLVSSSIVNPDDTAVLLPVPNSPGAAPHSALLTLTTCHPPFSASHRLILVARLATTAPRQSTNRPTTVASGKVS